jgi:hypothetical protein
MALPSLLARPRLDRALVPAAFLAWAATKYTWLLVDLSGALQLVPFVYAWRFLAIGLLLAALLVPTRGRGGPAEA